MLLRETFLLLLGKTLRLSSLPFELFKSKINIFGNIPVNGINNIKHKLPYRNLPKILHRILTKWFFVLLVII